MIRQIRSSDPHDACRARRGNVRGCFPSRKMGHTIQYESLTNELSAIYLMEYYEDDVWEYWDQPTSFTLRYKTKAEPIMAIHTPDFFVLRRDSAGWEEWKMENCRRWPRRCRLDMCAVKTKDGIVRRVKSMPASSVLLSPPYFGGDQLGAAAESAFPGRLPARRRSAAIDQRACQIVGDLAPGRSSRNAVEGIVGQRQGDS